MPYLESNSDVSENSTFNKALAVLGTITFAAAAGQMAFKSIAEKWGQGFGKGQLAKLGEKATERDVIKTLYGNNNELNARDYERLWRRTGDNPVPIRSRNGAQYTMDTTSSGAPKFVRTGGTAWERFRENNGPSWFRNSNGQDLQNLNREMKNLWKGAGKPGAKLDIYTDLVGNKGNLNLGADDFTKATEHLYSGEGQSAGRRAMGWDDSNYNKEIDWMNGMWGGNSLSPAEQNVANAKAAAAKANANAQSSVMDKIADDNRLSSQELKDLGVIPDYDEPRADGQVSFFDRPGTQQQGPPRPPVQPEQLSFFQ